MVTLLNERGFGTKLVPWIVILIYVPGSQDKFLKTAPLSLKTHIVLLWHNTKQYKSEGKAPFEMEHQPNQLN